MIKKIIQITSAAQSYRKVEFSVDLNPFINDINRYDYDELTLTGIFQAPDGRKLKQAAFFYQEYARMQNDIFGEITKRGAPHFRFRFTPDMAGWWTLTVRVFPLPSEDVTALFYVKQGGRPNRGIIRVDRVSNRFFIDGAGKTFIPIGCNLAWYTKRNGLVDYQRWLAALQANNMNITRVWLAPWTFALHSNHYADFTQALERLYRLDWLMENAERQGVYIILTLLNHGQFSTKINPTWNENPWNEINGGPLQYPIDFFISPEAKRIYKSQLRYIIARYGYAAQIFAWELINEIDHIDDYQAYRDQVTLWQQEMAAFIREIDSYCHLVTTSYYSEFGPAFKLREIDFVAAHSYDYADLDIYQAAPLKINEAYRQYQKPVLYAEFGISYRSGAETYRLDPAGAAITAGLWSNLFGGAAGGAMPWWWDNYIEKYNLFSLYRPVGKLALLFDFSYENVSALTEVKIDNPYLKIIGYRLSNRIYGYLFGNFNADIPAVAIAFPVIKENQTLEVYTADQGEIYTEYHTEVNQNQMVAAFLRLSQPLVFIIS